MGCAIDEVVTKGDSVIVWAEGECITYILVSGKPKYTAFSSNYFYLFRFRPMCRLEHEEAALGALLGTVDQAPKVKIKNRRKKKIRKKKIRVLKYAIDPANLVSWKLRDKQYWNFDQFPADEMVSSSLAFSKILLM